MPVTSCGSEVVKAKREGRSDDPTRLLGIVLVEVAQAGPLTIPHRLDFATVAERPQELIASILTNHLVTPVTPLADET